MRPFVMMQVAFSLIVLFVGGLLVRSFVKLIQRGSWIRHVGCVARVLGSRTTHGAESATRGAAAGARSASRCPRCRRRQRGRGQRARPAVAERLPVPGTARETIEATMAPVTPGFFETMKIPLLAGRTFSAGDLDTERPTVVIVNESFAKRYFGGEPPVGRCSIRASAGHARRTRSSASSRMFATTCASRRRRRSTSCSRCRASALCTSACPAIRRAVASRIREEVRAATPLLRVTTVTSQEAMVNRTLVRERLLAVLSGFFALVGLVLTAVGLYGTLSYAVVQRTREIGIRVALGARAVGAVRSVLADTARTTLIGAACGLAGGLYASRFVETMLFEVAARDVWSLALPLGTLLLAAFVAAVVPAWRAARVDPVIALRNE